MTEPSRSRAGFLSAAEVALAVVTLCTVAGMWRLFVDGSFFVPLALHAIAAHVLAAGLRRRGVAPATSALICLIVALLALVWGHLLDATSYGFPTGQTATAAADQLEAAWRTFGDVRAPAPVLDGFLLSAGAAVWVGAWLADLAAFRLWTPFEALIPSGTLFIFASLFSADRARALAAAIWLASAFAFVLLHRCARQQASPSWLGSDARAGTWALVRVGAGVATVAVVAGWVVGPNLPGAEAEGVVAVSAGDGGGSRTTVSPLVEIHRRLIEQSQSQLFTVDLSDRADRQYWRLTALDIFDGEIWSSRGSFGGAGGDLGDGSDADLPAREVTQHIDVQGLAAIWLPAAYEASGIDVEDAEVRWDDVTSTLIVGRDIPTSDLLEYDVTSSIVSHEAAALAEATGVVPDDVRRRDLELPVDFPPAVVAEAQRIVTEAGATTDYARAMALQDYFSGPASTFTYSLEVPPGHSDSAIEDFLFVTRAGYCEQFGGTYAAMARAIGLPARVAVGFTPGDPDPTEPNRFIVRGEHAHAWPEVYLGGVGWVAFEPTPGRGMPGAQSYTGRPESQDTAGESTAPAVTPSDGATPDPNTPGTGPSIPTETTIAPGEALGEVLTTPDDDTWLDRVPFRAIGQIVGVLIVAAGSIVFVTVVNRAVSRRTRRRTATTSEARVGVAFVEAEEALALQGLFCYPWETRVEFARRLSSELHMPEVVRLGEVLTRAEFDPQGIAEQEAVEADEIAALIASTVRARTPWWRRALAQIDPRSTRRQAAAARGRGQRPTGTRIQILPALAER